MKNIVIFLLLACCVYAYERPRMSYQGTQKEHQETFDFFHDNETGQEIVCVFGTLNSPSCYLTGRKW